ncbi:hypothetical protein DOTSEDRAFT_71319 [Dothistroma septosporum NZE10]|uniref:Transcription initiation factor IIE subunit beta n=1 Tax=Dothistroma septosporum (strain NZE10 / CBS 128990) TaxID=675120 RepID=N1PQ97_DOTSN|nr:hypothetical protein DOTSEDRAFT_71319 [Dothistroma septosporum NZE10]
MSLNASLAAFKKERADTVSRNISHARPASSTPARISTPQPQVAVDTAKRSHDSAFSSGATDSGSGNELFTQVHYARTHLKSKSPALLTFEDVISYLSLPVDAERNIPRIKEALKGDERVEFVPKSKSGNNKDCFKYRPLHPVTNAEELKEYLAIRSTYTAAGVTVKELKDGWPDCVPAIDQLEKEGFVLATRHKKDNAPVRIYADSPSYHIHIDDDFRDFCNKTKLPASELDIRNELERAGITPTSQVKEIRKGNTQKKERKRINRIGTKITNKHMNGILKNFDKPRRS